MVDMSNYAQLPITCVEFLNLMCHKGLHKKSFLLLLNKMYPFPSFYFSTTSVPSHSSNYPFFSSLLSIFPRSLFFFPTSRHHSSPPNYLSYLLISFLQRPTIRDDARNGGPHHVPWGCQERSVYKVSYISSNSLPPPHLLCVNFMTNS